MIRHWFRRWLGIDVISQAANELFKDSDTKITVLDNSQSDAFDAISRQATMIEEMKKDIKLLIDENIELRKSQPRAARPARNFTDFKKLVEAGSDPAA